MYSRPREDFGICLPGDYCGTTFKEEEANRHGGVCDTDRENTRECGREASSDCHSDKRGAGISSVFSQFPLFSGLSSLGLSVPKFGAEDILIIATAAFLFFSKTGDKECAIMLLLLIFIAN